MTNLHQLTTSQLREIIAIKEKIEAYQNQLDSIIGGGAVEVEVPKKRRMSPSARARIAAAQKARWAKIKGNGTPAPKAAKKKDRRSSPATRAKLAAAAKARWARVKAEGKMKL
jgi:hypothetical protein